MNGFTFYKNYYDIIKYLNDDDKLTMFNAILEYMFEDKEPSLKGLNLGIWTNLKMPLDTSKNNSLRSKGKGAPKGNQNAAKKQTENKPKTNRKQTENKQIYISNFLFLFSYFYISNNSNKEYIYSLFKEYLELRIKKKYTLTETVVKRLINKCNEYGKTDEEKINVITNAINGAWKDFYPIKETKHTEKKPKWYGKEIEEEKATDDEIEKIERALRK